jgi:hypothetical protein
MQIYASRQKDGGAGRTSPWVAAVDGQHPRLRRQWRLGVRGADEEAALVHEERRIALRAQLIVVVQPGNCVGGASLLVVAVLAIEAHSQQRRSRDCGWL